MTLLKALALFFGITAGLAAFLHDQDHPGFDLKSLRSLLKDVGHSHARAKRAVDKEGPFLQPWKDFDWQKLGKDRIAENIAKTHNKKKAKNVILFIGDGMGLSTVASARVFRAQQESLTKEKIYLSWENFPFASLSRTYNVDRITSDSAGTGTAYFSGQKVNIGNLLVNANVFPGECDKVEANKLESILHKSIKADKSTGIVTTTRLTHASPAASYASTVMRNYEGASPPGSGCVDIAKQLVTSDRNQKIKVLLGGGSIMLVPDTENVPNEATKGSRKDGVNLINEWKKRKAALGASHSVIHTKSQLASLDPNTEYVLGLFNPSHLNFESDRASTEEPSIAEMTGKAIEVLKKNDKGFFLFVEGGRIDQAHHFTFGKRALIDTVALHNAVKKAMEMTDPEETLIIVSADHSHVFTVGGYGRFDKNILGFGDDIFGPTLDGKPFLQLAYANGPGALYHRFKEVNGTLVSKPRLNLTLVGDDIYKNDFQQDAAVPNSYETHGGEDVAIYAKGPWAHLFQSTEEQSYIAHVMMYSSCVGDYSTEPHCPVATLSSASLLGPQALSLLLVAAALALLF